MNPKIELPITGLEVRLVVLFVAMAALGAAAMWIGRRRPAVTLSGLVVVFAGLFATSVVLQRREMKRVLVNAPFAETWQLGGRSATAMKALAGNYDLLAADFLWLRAIQSFGGRGMTNRDPLPLYNMFDTITELDPYFEQAYTFGNLVVGEEGRNNAKGMELLRKGTWGLFKQYRIPFEGMYVSHWNLNDTKTAKWYGRVATKRRDAPDWISRITAYIEVESGEYYVGLDRFIGNFLRSIDEKQSPMQAISMEKIRETLGKWNASILVKAADEYTTKTGKAPTRIEDLIDMPALKNYETARVARVTAEVARRGIAAGLENGGLFPEVLDDMRRTAGVERYNEFVGLLKTLPPAAKPAAGKNMASQQNEVFQAVLEKRSGIPEDPYGKGYVLNPATAGDRAQKPNERFPRIDEAENTLRTQLLAIRAEIDRRKKELGRNPDSLDEVYYTEFKTPDPMGGAYEYTSATATVKSASRPAF